MVVQKGNHHSLDRLYCHVN